MKFYWLLLLSHLYTWLPKALLYHQKIDLEVYEELNIYPEDYQQLWYEDLFASLEKTIIRMWFFEADISSVWRYHILQEGQAVKSFKFDEVLDLEMCSIMKEVINRHYTEKRSIKK